MKRNVLLNRFSWRSRRNYRNKSLQMQYLYAIFIALISFSYGNLRAQTTNENFSPTFEITQFIVAGNTLLNEDRISSLLSPFVGKGRNLGDAIKARQALQDEYHRSAYVLVQVLLPEQAVENGVVQLNVKELHIGTLQVQGNTFFSDANILMSMPSLRPGGTYNSDQISSELKLANENPSKNLTIELRNSEQNENIDVRLKTVDKKLWNFGSYIDNTGDSTTGVDHLSFQFQYTNMFDSDQVLSIQYTSSLENPGSMHVYGLGYHIPLYSLRDSLDFDISYSDINAGTITAGPLNLAVTGKGIAYGMRYNQSLPGGNGSGSRLIYGIGYKIYKNDILSQGIQLGSDVTVHPVSLTYSGIWTKPWGTANYSLGLVHNLARGDGESFALNRFASNDSYSLLQYGLNITSELASGWQLHSSISGQTTEDALVSGDQFGLGGASSVRGYREREVSDDQGIRGTLELYTPNLCKDGESRSDCRLLGFVDAGHLWRNKALPGELTQISLSGVGLGFRVNFWRNASLQVDYASALESTEVTNKGDSKLYFRMDISY